MHFSGTHTYSLDAKGRLAIPARFRAPFIESGEDIRVVQSIEEPHVKIYPREAWEKLEARIDAIEDSVQRRRARRAIFGGAHPTALDGQGRVLLPQPLRDYAGLSGEVVIVGDGDHLQVWAPQRWQAAFDEAVANTRDSAALVAQLGF